MKRKVYSYAIQMAFVNGKMFFALVEKTPYKIIAYYKDGHDALRQARDLMAYHTDEGEKATIEITNSVWLRIDPVPNTNY